MKPSQRIFDSCCKNNLCQRSADLVNGILLYLDEEAEKQRYVCPNCHRIVNELIKIVTKKFKVLMIRPTGEFGETVLDETICCEHCAPEIKSK